MRLRKGSLLIEVMVALLIGSVIVTLLVQTNAQILQIYNKTTLLAEKDRMFFVMQQRLENDLCGLIVPDVVLAQEKTRDQLAQENTDDALQKHADTKKPGSKSTNDKKENALPYSFYSSLDDKNNCILLTGITTNPLESYDACVARLVRVVYRLEEDPEHQGLFMLMRQQSDDLDFKKFSVDKEQKNNIPRYTLADRIVSFKIDFFIPKQTTQKINTTQEKAVKNDKDTKNKREWVTLDQWQELSPEEVKKQKKEDRRPELPSFIKITCVMQDAYARDFSYTLWVAPLYDMQQNYVEEVTTLPSRHEEYHRKFAEYRTKEHYQMVHEQKQRQKTKDQL